MSVAEDRSITSVRDQVSDAEWQTRVDLAATYRLVAHYGWSDLIYTHISARVPDAENHFLINPYGMTFDEITASSLVKVDLEGNIVMDTPYMINPAGFTIHSAVHAEGKDAHAVIHTHSDDGVAVSAQADGLLPLSQTSMIVMADLAYHDYEGIALDHDERERLIADLGDKHSMILRNHGLLTCGATCADAFLRLFFLERACSMQVKAMSGGAKLQLPAPDVIDKVASQARFQDANGIGNLAWPALLRTIDRVDPSYRD
ncbi:MAG: class II aldolase/adducin family protein [Parvibaculaceae bacterium]